MTDTTQRAEFTREQQRELAKQAAALGVRTLAGTYDDHFVNRESERIARELVPEPVEPPSVEWFGYKATYSDGKYRVESGPELWARVGFPSVTRLVCAIALPPDADDTLRALLALKDGGEAEPVAWMNVYPEVLPSTRRNYEVFHQQHFAQSLSKDAVEIAVPLYRHPAPAPVVVTVDVVNVQERTVRIAMQEFRSWFFSTPITTHCPDDEYEMRLRAALEAQ